MSEGETTSKYDKAIAALMSTPTIKAAADLLGVNPRTVYTWLDDPAFADAYRAARRVAVGHATARMQQLSSDAVNVVRTVMNNTKVHPSIRLAAAKLILEMSIKAVELEDVIARLDVLERLNAQKL